jgi:hypothetical protein
MSRLSGSGTLLRFHNLSYKKSKGPHCRKPGEISSSSRLSSAASIILLTSSWLRMTGNQSARQALHELHKYVALMKVDYGLRDSQIRCILVSTDNLGGGPKQRLSAVPPFRTSELERNWFSPTDFRMPRSRMTIFSILPENRCAFCSSNSVSRLGIIL